MRLAGLRLVIGGHLHIHIIPGVGSRCHSFSLCFVGLDLNDSPHYLKRNKNPGGACGLFIRLNTCSVLMESPQIGGFVEGQHEIKKSGVERQND